MILMVFNINSSLVMQIKTTRCQLLSVKSKEKEKKNDKYSIEDVRKSVF